MTEPTTEIMVEVAEDLRGTCQSLNNVLEERGIDFDSIPIALLETLDAEVMECQVCGWWHESCELNDDQICKDCEDD